MRNLSDNTAENDLYELFGHRSTKHLKQNCSLKMSTNSNTGNRKYFFLCHCVSPHNYGVDKVKLNKVYRSSRPEVFCKKVVIRNFAKFTGKHLCQGVFFNKVVGLRDVTLLKKRL